jgi:hypothetical protein
MDRKLIARGVADTHVAVRGATMKAGRALFRKRKPDGVVAVTQTQTTTVDASQHAAAIARWDDEGGAPRSSHLVPFFRVR